MTHALFAAISAAALALAAAAPAAAGDAPEVRIRDAAARMVVIVEDRADVSVEVSQGSTTLPRPTVAVRGNETRIDGGLGRNATRNCQAGPANPPQPGQGASVEVRRIGRVNVSDAPMIVVRAPRNVSVNVEGGAVWGSIGRGAQSISLGNSGCGDWTVANTAGHLELSVAGSGDVWAGTSESLEVSMAGSGDIGAGATGRLEASIAGSGNVTAAQVNGPVEASIAGSGDVTVRGGQVGSVEANIAGSGNVTINGRVQSVEANIMGSGDVNVGAVSGQIERAVMGSGSVNVGGH